MFLEIIGCTLMGGLLTFTYADKNALTDGAKIQRITKNCGLTADEGKTIYLLRKARHTWGREFVYRIPLGLSFNDFQSKKDHIEDGLNHTRGLWDISIDDIKAIQWNGDILAQIKKIISGTKQKKEILMDYDGTLKVRVYREPLKKMVPFDEDTLKNCKGWNVFIGESREGTLYHDFDKIPHMVVAGITQYGKSVFLKNAVTTLIHTQSKNVTISLIDLKGGLAFNRFKKINQVDTVAKDVDEALATLKEIQQSMKKRQADFLDRGYENSREAKSNKRHFIIIDEGAELASVGTIGEGKRKRVECERIVSEIARIGGGLGYRLIFATQYPTGDTLPRQVKQNCDSRLCFRLSTDVASRVVLDESGAEEIPLIQGRAIYRTDRKYIVQTPFIENDFIDDTIRPHIAFKPRREVNHEYTKDTERGNHTLVISEA